MTVFSPFVRALWMVIGAMSICPVVSATGRVAAPAFAQDALAPSALAQSHAFNRTLKVAVTRSMSRANTLDAIVRTAAAHVAMAVGVPVDSVLFGDVKYLGLLTPKTRDVDLALLYDDADVDLEFRPAFRDAVHREFVRALQQAASAVPGWRVDLRRPDEPQLHMSDPFEDITVAIELNVAPRSIVNRWGFETPAWQLRRFFTANGNAWHQALGLAAAVGYMEWPSLLRTLFITDFEPWRTRPGRDWPIFLARWSFLRDAIAAWIESDPAGAEERLVNALRRPLLPPENIPLQVLRGGKKGRTMSDLEPVALADPVTALPMRQGAGRLEAHQKSLWHQVVHVYLRDKQGRVLLQRRSRRLAVSPGKLQVSVSGHVDIKDIQNVVDLRDPAWAFAVAIREGQEELGITLDPRKLTLVSPINGIRRDDPENREFASVFVYSASDAEIEQARQHYDTQEVEELVLLPFERLPEAVQSHPDLFSGSIRHLLQRYPEIVAAIYRWSPLTFCSILKQPVLPTRIQPKAFQDQA